MTVPHLIPAVEASTAPAAFAAVRANGLRLSTARRLLLQALFDADRPLSAEELAGDGDVASAYRNLEVLEGLGLVQPRPPRPRPGRYQPAGRPREFVVCEGCGDVVAVAPAAVAARALGRARRASASARAFTHFPRRRAVPGLRLARTADAHAYPRRADPGRVGAARARSPPRSPACTSSASVLLVAVVARSTSGSAAGAFGVGHRDHRLHARACATPSTPTTSPRSTTPPAS